MWNKRTRLNEETKQLEHSSYYSSAASSTVVIIVVIVVVFFSSAWKRHETKKKVFKFGCDPTLLIPLHDQKLCVQTLVCIVVFVGVA